MASSDRSSPRRPRRDGAEVKSVTLIQHRKHVKSQSKDSRYAPNKQQLRAVFGAARNRVNSPPPLVTLPSINAATLAEIEAKYGPVR